MRSIPGAPPTIYSPAWWRANLRYIVVFLVFSAAVAGVSCALAVLAPQDHESELVRPPRY